MHNMKKQTVTIALSAYNEESNIKNFLLSLLVQKEEGFLLKNIIVISDGSTDSTVKIAKSVKSKKIQIIDSKIRMGKSVRLNAIYRMLDTDILVQSDADIILKGPNVLRNIIKPLL